MSLTTTISQLRGGTQFMFDVVDRPDEVRALAEAVLEALLAVQAEVARLNPLPDGTAHRWLNYWNPGHGFWFSEDDAVMMAAEMFRDLFLDLDKRLCAATDIAALHWHTVGLHLIPVLLEIPNLRMIQLSFDPNGPDFETVLAACRQIEAAGRKVCFQMGFDEGRLRTIFKSLQTETCMFYLSGARDFREAEHFVRLIEHLSKQSTRTA